MLARMNSYIAGDLTVQPVIRSYSSLDPVYKDGGSQELYLTGKNEDERLTLPSVNRLPLRVN